MIRRLPINDFLTQSQHHLIIDVRSPGEYGHAHIPGANSIPLFTDEERKQVGTAYKQESREKAIKIGLDYFGPKMRPIVEQVEALAKDNTERKKIFIYCWRGGMRSGAIAWLLDLYGFNVSVLAGGYKAFRNYVLSTFQQPYSFHILGGYTGSGKTELLHELKKKGETIVDLEGIASHKGSAFGSIGMPAQPTQEMFENMLGMELQRADPNQQKVIWLEDESQRIGLNNIPATLWSTMRNSPIFFVDIPFESRLDHLVEEYGCLEKDKLSDAIVRITKRLGGLDTKNALQYLEEENFKECFRILLSYYDKHYHKGLHKRENVESLISYYKCAVVTPENADVLNAVRQ